MTEYGFDVPAALTRAAVVTWPTVSIILMLVVSWQAGVAMLLLTGPFLAFLWGGRRAARKRARAQRRREKLEALGRTLSTVPGLRSLDLGPYNLGPYNLRPVDLRPPGDGRGSSPERRLAAAVVRAETSGGRLDDECLALVREVDQGLRPLLAAVRSGRVDVRVRRDVEAIATEHLPGALDAYLVLPAEYARTHRTAAGTTPADELRAQLHLLVEGCRQLCDAVHEADAARQQELSHYLDGLFRRSALDL